MHFQTFLLAAFASSAWALATPVGHVLHEKRTSPLKQWVKRGEVHSEAVLPMRIGLVQSNIDNGRGTELLDEVSDPTSTKYGKWYTAEEIHDIFAPTKEQVDGVFDWIMNSGIDPARISHSTNKQWVQFDAKVHEAERLLKTKYYHYEHAATGSKHVACDEYYVPEHLADHIDYVTPGLKLLAGGKASNGRSLDARKRELEKRGFRTSANQPFSGPVPGPNITIPLTTLNATEFELSHCDEYITPPCIALMYNITKATRAAKGNELGIFEEGDYYAAEDLVEFFAAFAPQIPLTTRPKLEGIDGGFAPGLYAGGESDLDFQISYPIIYPQNSILFQTDDIFYATGLEGGGGFLNTFLDAIDGSYCTYSAYGEQPTSQPLRRLTSAPTRPIMTERGGEPRLLYAINGIKAYHIQNGEEQSLTPSGPQTLSLLMVPTSSPFAELSSTIPQNEAPDEDFYLHLNLPPELDLPLPATTQIYHQPPSSYLIPRWDLGPDSGAFTRIEFPSLGYGVTQDDVDTFETILAQCTAFLERARPPLPERKGEKGGAYQNDYNPADYAPGGKYYDEKSGGHGQIVLIDEDNGSIVGELGENAQIAEDSKLRPGNKDPVEIQVSQDGTHIDVRPVSEGYLRMAKHPAYKDSSLVGNAATASRLIVTGSSYIGNVLTQGAGSFTQKTKPVPKPLEFKQVTHDRVRKINSFTQSAAGMTSKTVGQITNYAQNFAAGVSGHKKNRPNRGFDEQGRELGKEEYKPGLLNKSMIAFSTIADGISYSGKNLLTSSGAAASTMVGHRWGEEAGSIATQLAGGVKNVGLVYIDVTGVSRRAVIKSVAKGMVIGRVRGGGEVVVGSGDGGAIPEEDKEKIEKGQGMSDEKSGGFGPQGGDFDPMNTAPPRYQESGSTSGGSVKKG